MSDTETTETEVPSTRIQWTMRLSDAALIADALRETAERFQSMADYIGSEGYAEQARDRYMAAPREEGERRRRADWVLPDGEKKRIVEYSEKAAQLRRLAES